MKKEAHRESKPRRVGTLGIAIRIAFGIWILAGVVWAAVSVGEIFRIAEGSRPKVVTDDLGNQVIVFQAAEGGIHGHLRSSRGRPIGVEFQISSVPEAIKPAVAVLRRNGFVVAWENGDEDEPAIVARRFSAGGRPIGVEFRIGADGRDPAIGIDDRDIMVAAWTRPADARALEFLHTVRRFEANGRPIGVEFLVSRHGPATPPALAVQDAGRFIVVWEDSRGDLVAQAFDVDGVPLTDAFRVNESRFGDQGSPDVTVALDGSYTVVWERVLPGSNGRQVYGRRVEANGRPIGVEFRVSESSSEGPTLPAVMADLHGNTVVTWVSYQDHRRVLAREVTMEGRPIGVEFQVDAGMAATSVRASRGGDTGDFFVVWDADEGESLIFGRDLVLNESD